LPTSILTRPCTGEDTAPTLETPGTDRSDIQDTRLQLSSSS